MTLLLALHAIAATVWVGGMFFGYFALRPALLPFDEKVRLPLWRRVFTRFFLWVWVAIVLLLVTGYTMFLRYGVTGIHVHMMQASGVLMILLFLHMFFAPWRRLQAAIDTQDFVAGARHLAQIRMTVALNLALGLITVVIGASGRYWEY
ncbi:MAG: CopD family protein [Rhodospirillales bacterium]|nr:CopD family protein [Rhodospirillales bacterium]